MSVSAGLKLSMIQELTYPCPFKPLSESKEELGSTYMSKYVSFNTKMAPRAETTRPSQLT